jgi:hypothetical protein
LVIALGLLFGRLPVICGQLFVAQVVTSHADEVWRTGQLPLLPRAIDNQPMTKVSSQLGSETDGKSYWLDLKLVKVTHLCCGKRNLFNVSNYLNAPSALLTRLKWSFISQFPREVAPAAAGVVATAELLPNIAEVSLYY